MERAGVGVGRRACRFEALASPLRGASFVLGAALSSHSPAAAPSPGLLLLLLQKLRGSRRTGLQPPIVFSSRQAAMLPARRVHAGNRAPSARPPPRRPSPDARSGDSAPKVRKPPYLGASRRVIWPRSPMASAMQGTGQRRSTDSTRCASAGDGDGRGRRRLGASKDPHAAGGGRPGLAWRTQCIPHGQCSQAPPAAVPGWERARSQRSALVCSAEAEGRAQPLRPPQPAHPPVMSFAMVANLTMSAPAP